jgi:hypothetical protein
MYFGNVHKGRATHRVRSRRPLAAVEKLISAAVRFRSGLSWIPVAFTICTWREALFQHPANEARAQAAIRNQGSAGNVVGPIRNQGRPALHRASAAGRGVAGCLPRSPPLRFFRAIGLAVRLVVLFGLASAICTLAGGFLITPP